MSYADAASAEMVEDAIVGARSVKGWRHARCPFCVNEGHESNKKNLRVSLRGYYQCWRCGESGWLRRGVEETAETVTPSTTAITDTTFEPPEGFEFLDGNESYMLAPARRYLESRGITDEAIRALKIGAVGRDAEDWHWRQRVVVPHLDEHGRWLGYVGRLWAAKPSKNALPYLYPAGMKRTLYNARVLSVETDEPALGFEGALDVAHYPDRAFAFFGSPTEDHIKEIERKAKRPVVIVLDGDMGDKSEMLGLRLRLDGLRAGWVTLPPLADPDEVPRAWLVDESKKAVACF